MHFAKRNDNDKSKFAHRKTFYETIIHPIVGAIADELHNYCPPSLLIWIPTYIRHGRRWANPQVKATILLKVYVKISHPHYVSNASEFEEAFTLHFDIYIQHRTLKNVLDREVHFLFALKNVFRMFLILRVIFNQSKIWLSDIFLN